MPAAGYGQGVKVSVTRQGGFLDVDQKVEVDEDGVSVTERGVERQMTPVDQDRVRLVSKLAKAVAELRETAVPAPKAGDVAAYDEMLTEIEIDDGEGVRRLSVPSGADAHPAVWELISAVDQCASE
jgi:hypothetical protein